MVLSKEQIEAADDLPYEDVEVPEWGGTVRLKMLDGEQREFVEIRMHQCQRGTLDQATKAWKGLKYKMLSFAIVDDHGIQQFSDKDVSALAKKNGSVIERLYEHIIKQNAFSKEEADQLAKNSV